MRLSTREGKIYFFFFSVHFFVVPRIVTEMSLAECSLISQAIDFAQGCFVLGFFPSLFKVFCNKCIWEYWFFSWNEIKKSTVKIFTGMSSQVYALGWGAQKATDNVMKHCMVGWKAKSPSFSLLLSLSFSNIQHPLPEHTYKHVRTRTHTHAHVLGSLIL